MFLAATCATGISVTACAVTGIAVGDRSSVPTPPSSSSPAIRQVDDAGRRLPFATKFPNRWSTNNDGTPYEPCTTVSESALASIGLDSESVSDAAVADHQTVRGCDWDFRGRRLSYAAQTVGNKAGSGAADLAGYKRVFSDFRWFPDRMLNSRTIALFSLGPNHCATILSAGRAFVVTTVGLNRTDRDVSENCELAFAFTRATIGQIPR